MTKDSSVRSGGVELLPCPICGDLPLRNGRGKVGGVLCTGISTPRLAHRVQSYGASQAEADEAWNTRAHIGTGG